LSNSRQHWSWRRFKLPATSRSCIKLPYKEYLRALELGIELPEATPTFQIGLLASCEAPEPVEVKMPEGFPLERCYRFDPSTDEDTDEANVHLLAALGQFVDPLIAGQHPKGVRRIQLDQAVDHRQGRA
jgi:hypothetical protein